MAVEYTYIKNYNRKGKLAISNTVFDQIICFSIGKIKGAKLQQDSKKSPVRLRKPIHCNIDDGKVTCDVEVIISQEANVNKVCQAIQQEIEEDIDFMTEYSNVIVNIKVVGIE